MGVKILPYEMKKVTARLVRTNKEYASYINNICEFEDIEYTNDLMVKTGGVDLDFGRVEWVEVYCRLGREYWDIKTTHSIFKFQIMNKTNWTEVLEMEEKTNVYSFNDRKLLNEIDQMINSFLDKGYMLGGIKNIWRR